MPEHTLIAPPLPFQIEISRDLGRIVVSPSGELDIATAPSVERAVEQLLDGGRAADAGADEISLDLSRLSFFDSSGIRLLLRLEHRIAGTSRPFTVTPGAGAAATVLRITRLDGRFAPPA